MTDDRDQVAESRALIARLSEDVVPTLIERLTNSELGELEVRESGWRIRLRRPLANGYAYDDPVAGGGATHNPPPASGHASSIAPRESTRGMVTSPAVGYFAPVGSVEVGSVLRSGDLIGHVDVLGVRHEVVASVAGALKAFEVESGEAVEFGQAIARLEVEG